VPKNPLETPQKKPLIPHFCAPQRSAAPTAALLLHFLRDAREDTLVNPPQTLLPLSFTRATLWTKPSETLGLERRMGKGIPLCTS
jgi:hypothetical protein